MEKGDGKKKRRESGMEATWLPTAIRGGGRHESHDDVTATIATSRRGQYVSPFPNSVPFPRLFPSRIIDAASPRISATRRCTERQRGRQGDGEEWWQWCSKRGRSLDASSLDQNP